MLNILSCAGAMGVSEIPSAIYTITNMIVNIIKFGIPVILIIYGMMDMGKAVMAQKEDEIKKGQQTFIKRCIAAAVVFFITAIVTLVVDLISSALGDTDNNAVSCINCFINKNDCN